MKNYSRVLMISILAVFLIYGSAIALPTPINPVGGGGAEPSLIAAGGILDTTYGLTNLARIDDLNDQIWKLCTEATKGTATFVAKYASNTQAFGLAETNGANPSSIFTVGPSPSPTDFTPTVSSFVFYDTPWFSKTDLNSPNEDHMVTWQVLKDKEGIDLTCTYVIAWEDTTLGSADSDYNDLVIQLQNVHPDIPTNNTIPEPATMLLLGSGLIGLAGFARRRFKK